MRMMGILGRGVLVAYCHQDIPSAAALIFPLIFFFWVQWLETLMAALRAFDALNRPMPLGADIMSEALNLLAADMADDGRAFVFGTHQGGGYGSCGQLIGVGGCEQ